MKLPAQTGDGRYLRALLDVTFTDDQLRIITAPLVPQLVVAGAGSGKTTVMAARVVHAVVHHHLEPGQVLGLTFTNKAAGELASRVQGALERLLLGGIAVDEISRPTVTTYHAYAAELLREHALRIGREPLTQVLTEAGRWQLATRTVRAAHGPLPHLAWVPSTVARRLLALDAELAEHRRSTAEVHSFDAELLTEQAAAGPVSRRTGPLVDYLGSIRARDDLLTLVADYRDRKERLDLVDFGDQVALAAEIAVRCPDVGVAYRDTFRLVLLDEYQDTGIAQRDLLVALFGGGHPVTAVGDPNQAIYGWRGASVGNLLRFPEQFPTPAGDPADVVPLMTSFRCARRILAVANRVAAPLRRPAPPTRRPVLDVPHLTAAPAAAEGGVRIALHATVHDEAAWTAAAIADAIDGGTSPGQVAVLCRARNAFPRLQEALTDRGVPVEVVGLGGLLEMPEVADVVCTLRLLVDPTDNGAALRLLAGPRWRIGLRDLAALGRRATRLTGVVEQTGDPLRDAAARLDPVTAVSLLDAVEDPGPADDYAPDALARFGRFAAELAGLREQLGQPIVELVTEVISRSGLDVEVAAGPEALARSGAANLTAFVHHAARFTGLDGTADLPAFLGFLDAASDVEGGLDVGAVPATDTVKILTVHKGKGLEWDVVAVPGLVAGVFPARPSGAGAWTRSAQLLPAPLRGDAADLPDRPAPEDAALEAFARSCREDYADEERRLGYVAFTRARRLLLASGYWWGVTQRRPAGPSELLRELHAQLAAGLVEVDTWVDGDSVGARNPLLEGPDRDVPWPSVPAEPAASERRRAADAVRRALAGTLAVPDDLDPAERAALAGWQSEVELVLAEQSTARAATRAVPLPRRLTTTQLVALAADPDGFAATLVRPVPARPGRQARRGTRFHAWVQNWVQEQYGERPLFDADELPGVLGGDTDPDFALLRERFLAGPYAHRRPVAVEAPFEFVVAGRTIRGRIDAVYRTGGGLDVLDFKTGRPPSGTAAAVQLSVYRLAWAEIAGVPAERVDAGFLAVREGRVVRPARLLDREELAALVSGVPPTGSCRSSRAGAATPADPHPVRS